MRLQLRVAGSARSVRVSIAAVALCVLSAASGCKPADNSVHNTPQDTTSHTLAFFKIDRGSHAVDCSKCHADSASFKLFNCTGCHAHDQEPTDALHANLTDAQVAAIGGTGQYGPDSASCYRCHKTDDGQRKPFSHTGVSSNCALCHAEGQSFAALPVTGFTHPEFGAVDCSACHITSQTLDSKTWNSAGGPAAPVFDPKRSLAITGQQPTFLATAITSLSADPQSITMPMLHTAQGIGLLPCLACHTGADSGTYYPGRFHAALDASGNPQPKAACTQCHAVAPTGFVGPLATSPVRNPASGEMRHDAVAWSGDLRGSTALVTQDCSVCHVVGAAYSASWQAGAVQFHASLTNAGLAQPASCTDCHANSRPSAAPQNPLTQANAPSLPVGMVYDHTISPAQSDCIACHAGASSFSSWAGGRYHHSGDAPNAQSTCLPCHAGERPTATVNPVSTWKSSSYPPFDTIGNGLGNTHGNGRDCVSCHSGPGTGAWGVNQTWAGAVFPHGSSTDAGSTCIACHSTQRPDLQPGAVAATVAKVLGFDHALNGTGDCIGCHTATVKAGTYASYGTPTTAQGTGDWKGGQSYPGAALIGAADQSVLLTEFSLLKTSAANPSFVTNVSQVSATLYAQMLHTSSAVPSQFGLGGANADTTQCWHCHANDGKGNVTAFANGRFHSSLATFSTSPGGTPTPLQQTPGTGCIDCHTQRPANIVERSSGSPPALSNLQPMDHNALFTATVLIGTVQASGAGSLDCATCHAQPGTTWSDGVFHSKIGSAQPADCKACHYLLMADTTVSNVSNGANGANYKMVHGSGQMGTQSCETCHTTALAGVKGAAPAAASAASLWKPGAFHASVAKQPTACLDCHASSVPSASTQGTVTYLMPKGGTATNGGQWISHASAAVKGKDCAACHATDAKTTVTVWSKSAPFHAAANPVQSCQGCHGLGNGSTAPGANNNLPGDITDSSQISTASANGTGVPAGTHDQISHTDVNVSSHDCNLCHTQSGPSANASIKGKEWAQASFHANVPTAQLVLDKVTGRCSNCHLNLKPGPSFVAFDHGSFSNTQGTQDCASCHQPGADWKSGVPGGPVSDARQAVSLTAQVANFTATVITSLTPRPETLPMPMVHSSLAVPASAFAQCVNCHVNAATAAYFPGLLHQSLTALGVSQPATCVECHATSMPTGLVGPLATAPVRSPSSGEMAHDAVAWSNGKRTTAALVPVECATCHVVGDWAQNAANTGAAKFHSNLGSNQPASCLDCHANSRPSGAGGILTQTNAATLPVGLSFDHTQTVGLADCTACHTASAPTFASWSGGRYHLAGSAAPSTCLPCHAGERPSATVNPVSSWKGASASAPFDSVTNALNVTHGDGLDCVSCHAGPGTGAWGSTQNWQGGAFSHASTTPAANTCIACHTTQRPDLQGASVAAVDAALGVPHETYTGDCIGCHLATVTAGSYKTYGNPTVKNSGDWKGGVAYPGSTLVSSTTLFITATETVLNRSGPNNLVTSTTATTQTLYNQMLHTSATVPAAVNAGPSSAPESAKCWHCHTGTPPTSTTVSSFANGNFHVALNDYSAALNGTVAPLPQPTACLDCHANMKPNGIVQYTGSDLQPMDHTATWPAATVNGQTGTTGVGSLDCYSCHKTSPGGHWNDGVFHANTKGAAPSDCTVCHYTLMADAAKSDVTSTVKFAMKHRSSQVTFQNCKTCHATALANVQAAPTTATTATLWATGQLHANLSSQPTLCLDCHAVSVPPGPTQSSLSYVFAQGSSTTNAAQWMSHVSNQVSGKDCVACHAAEATTATNAATLWSKSAGFHANVAATTCNECHGLTNGSGSVVGTGNNLPVGLTNSTMVTTASADATTGIASGTLDQISHADASVTSRDCAACHTQKGPSTVTGIKGKEWAQAAYHAKVTPAPTACVGCHFSLMPTAASFTKFNHNSLVSPLGTVVAPNGTKLTTDCAGCHTTNIGTNWTGALGAAPHTLAFLQTASCVTCHTVGGATANTGGTLAGGTAIGMPTGTITTVATKISFIHKDPGGAFDFSLTNCIVCHAAAANYVLVPVGGTNIINKLTTTGAPWAMADMGAPSKTPITALTATTPTGTTGTAGFHWVLPTVVTYTGATVTISGGVGPKGCLPCHGTDTKGLNKHCNTGQTQITTDCIKCHNTATSSTKVPSWNNTSDGNPTCK